MLYPFHVRFRLCLVFASLAVGFLQDIVDRGFRDRPIQDSENKTINFLIAQAIKFTLQYITVSQVSHSVIAFTSTLEQGMKKERRGRRRNAGRKNKMGQRNWRMNIKKKRRWPQIRRWR